MSTYVYVNMSARINMSRKNAKGMMFRVEKSRNFYDISRSWLPRSSYSRSTTPGFTLGFFLSGIHNQSSRGHNGSTFCHLSEPRTSEYQFGLYKNWRESKQTFLSISISFVRLTVTMIQLFLSRPFQDPREVRQKTGVALKGRRGRSTLGLLLHTA